MSYEIAKMLIASTAHVSEDTCNQLPRGASNMDSPDDSWGPAFTRNEGWLFYVGGDLARFADAPQDLLGVVKLANRQGCEWLMLDADGPCIDELPTYGW